MLTSLAAALVTSLLTVPALPPHDLLAQEPPPRTTTERPAPLNLNAATEAQLEALPGIGAATAARIVEYRKKNGGFKKVEEILETSRSSPIMLTIARRDPLATVSGSRNKSQEISL